MNQYNTEQLEELRQGKPEVFEALIQAYQDRVVSTCSRFVHHQSDAEDVAQEVFVEIYQSIGSFRGESKLSTWIYRISVMKSLDFLRKQKRMKRLGHMKRVLGWEDQPDEVVLQASQEAGPDEILEVQESQEALRQAVESLPQSQRIAITLHKLEQLPTTEVSEIMGTTVSAVEGLIHRAKKRLHKTLTHYYDKKIVE